MLKNLQKGKKEDDKVKNTPDVLERVKCLEAGVFDYNPFNNDV